MHQMHVCDILANAASGYNAFAFSNTPSCLSLYITTGKRKSGIAFFFGEFVLDGRKTGSVNYSEM